MTWQQIRWFWSSWPQDVPIFYENCSKCWHIPLKVILLEWWLKSSFQLLSFCMLLSSSHCSCCKNFWCPPRHQWILHFWSQQPGGTAAAEAEKHPCIHDLVLLCHIAGAWLSTCIFVAGCAERGAGGAGSGVTACLCVLIHFRCSAWCSECPRTCEDLCVCNDTHQLQGSASGRNSFFPCFGELCLPKSPHGQRDPKCSCASKEQLKLQAEHPRQCTGVFCFF